MTTTFDKKIILIVDDIADNIDVVNGILIMDYKVKIALNGERAIKIASSEPHPDLILLDVMMPGMDGYEVCQTLKNNPVTSDIPIIFLSANNEAEDISKGVKLGAIDYITKPVNPDILKLRIRNHLALVDQNREVEEKVNQRTKELQELNQKLTDELASFK